MNRACKKKLVGKLFREIRESFSFFMAGKWEPILDKFERLEFFNCFLKIILLCTLGRMKYRPLVNVLKFIVVPGENMSSGTANKQFVWELLGALSGGGRLVGGKMKRTL